MKQVSHAAVIAHKAAEWDRVDAEAASTKSSTVSAELKDNWKL